jgi:hypothetical protein
MFLQLTISSLTYNVEVKAVLEGTWAGFQDCRDPKQESRYYMIPS